MRTRVRGRKLIAGRANSIYIYIYTHTMYYMYNNNNDNNNQRGGDEPETDLATSYRPARPRLSCERERYKDYV
jgi:hypothetical protein